MSQARPPVPVLLATALAVLLLGVVLVVGLTGDPDPPAREPATGPLALPEVPAPDAGSTRCATLLDALPRSLRSGPETLPARELARPAPRATAAWGSARPVVLRCGLVKPPELTPTAQLLDVSGVRWLEVPGPGTSTWYAVDRRVYVALTVPDGLGTGPLQQASTTVGKTLDAVRVRP